MNEAIEVVRHPRARSARLSVDPATGAVRLTIPRRASERAARAWAESKRGWIEAQRAQLPQPRPFVPGAELPFAGETVRIDWCERGARRPAIIDGILRCGGPREGLERRIERWLRGEALALLSAETEEFAERAGVSVERVSVGDPRSRWGSCSSRGGIRYSWRLILAPTAVRRATVAHEVAHRVHMNHGPDFHALVAKIYGEDPSPARQWLRTHGAALHWFGRES
ncbi:M48 family metallopeptidase [Stakelama marina]|uniref:M48 family metallopeptidase n=1 Tax=Stakelama marina TaxID=2826939 RepID=A0A8T4IKT3_9SPHN|nr:SprT family zinc-dependent metalloprotease [Stakelama marina]MBR0552969.1 M48 family metallopeptidase [Stakelama marina]